MLNIEPLTLMKVELDSLPLHIAKVLILKPLLSITSKILASPLSTIPLDSEIEPTLSTLTQIS